MNREDRRRLARSAAQDQATAAALAAARSVPGAGPVTIVDSRDALMTMVVDQDGTAHFTATTDDLRWIANSLAKLAAAAEQRALAAGQ